MVWIKFIVSVLIILYSGKKLSLYGDILSKKTGLGGGFIGVILLGAVTSLPELITTISSVALVKQVNLAWGNILGSNLLNLTILGFSDLLIKKNQKFRIFDSGNVITGGLSSIITIIALIGLVIGKDIILFNSISIYSIIILFIYFGGSFLLYRNEMKSNEDNQNKQINNEKYPSLKKIILIILFYAGLIVIAGISVTYACDEIAKITNWGASFVGTLFLAIATSLPEITVSISSISIGALSMAVGNILGSNFFNVSILGISDFFYHSGQKSIFLDASKIHLLTGLIFILVTNIIIIGMIYKSKKRLFRFGLDSVLIIVLYVLTFYYLYKMR